MPEEVVISEEQANAGFSVDDIINMSNSESEQQGIPQTGNVNEEVQETGDGSEDQPANVNIEIKREITADGSDQDQEGESLVEPDEGDSGVEQPSPRSIEDIIREKTGGKYSTWEDIEPLLSKPPEMEFENDFSKSLYDNIRSGNIDEVVQKLSLQQKLKDVDTMNEEDAIKLAMKLKHPGWDNEDVEDEYDNSFAGLDSEDNSEARAARRKLKDAHAEAKEYLAGLKSDIKLPEIKNQVPDITPEIKKQQEEFSKNVSDLREKYLNSLDKTKSEFNGFEFNVEDDDIKLKTSFNIDKEGKEKYMERLKDFDLDQFFEKNYMSDDRYDTDRLARDLWMIERDDKGVPNYQKLIVSQLKQVLTEAKRAVIGSIKGRDTHAAISHPSDLNKTTRDKDVDAYLEATS